MSPALMTPLDAKRLATAQARAALAGFTLSQIEADDGRPQFIVTRWSLTRSFSNLAEVEAFLSRLGARIE